jgi:hypothetical protein
VDLVADGRGNAVVIEGAADVVDYEVLDRAGRPIAVRQAKTRLEPATWRATELARILRVGRGRRHGRGRVRVRH